MATGEQAPQPRPPYFERSLPGWHAACYGLLAVLVVTLLIAEDDPTRRAAGFVLTAAFAAAYTLLGRHLLGKGDDVRGSVYLAIATVIATALLHLTPAGSLLIFVLFPQIWAIVTTRPAVIVTVLFVVGMTVSLSARGGWTQEATRDAAVTGGVNLVMALVLGLWISGLIRESDQRAHLIEQLQAARAELASAHHQQGMLAERTRLAAEIHDTLAQGFTSLVVLIQAAEAGLDTGDTSAVRERLTLAEATARENLAESRALIAEPGALDLQAATLPDAVRRLADRTAAELGVPVELCVDGEPRGLSSSTQVVLLRATQEALANVRKHAAPGRVAVSLSYDSGCTTLDVTDDGRGFEPSRVSGFGLQGMRRRVEQVGGDVELSSAPGAGTTVRVRLP